MRVAAAGRRTAAALTRLLCRGLLRLLAVLLSSKMMPDDKKQILSGEFNIPMTKTLDREVASMCNLGHAVFLGSFGCGVIGITRLQVGAEDVIKMFLGIIGLAIFSLCGNMAAVGLAA